jgi:DNA end-binding protein Ku
MASPRANWKGSLAIGDLSCPVALYTAASTAERISLHTVNARTGNRVRREFVDPATGKPVDRDQQIKGYALDDSHMVLLEPEDIAKAVPESDKRLKVEAFIACDDIDTVFFDKPYYLAPAGEVAQEAFLVIRDAMREEKVAALARTVLFKRVRTLMIRAHGEGLIAHTLNYDYEVRSAATAFEDVADIKIKKDMLDLARHIVETKAGTFDPSAFDDRYEAAVADMVRAKLAGKPLKRRKDPKQTMVVDLMEALRASAGASKAAPAKAPAAAKAGKKPAKSSAKTRKAAGSSAKSRGKKAA